MKKQLLIVLGVLIALPALARDFTYTYEGQTLTYTVLDEDAKTCRVKSGAGVSGAVIIPEIAKNDATNYAVTSIGDYAFCDCTGLTSVTIGNSVTTIGNYAFSLCNGLTSVEIPNSVTDIGNYAFSFCNNLKSVNIGNSVIIIGEKAFCRCRSLTSVTIPTSVVAIGNYAFCDCSSLTSVTIPNSVAEIESGSFASCTNLLTIDVEPSNSYFTSIDGVLYNIEKTTLIQYPAGKKETNFEIPTSVTVIGDCAFYGCSGLISVTIPNSVTSIGLCAFLGCSGLTSIEIPASVASIGENAFMDCTGLTEVTIPNSVTSIGNLAFTFNPSLTDVTFEDGVQSIEIGNGNFSGSGSTLEDKQIKNLKWGRPMESLTFPTESLETLTIGNVIEEIPAGKFSNLTKLNSLTLGANIKTIGNEAFSGCPELTEVVLPPSVETIGTSAFEGDSKLTDITLGHSVATIGSRAFYDCPVETVNITAQTPPVAGDDTFSDYSGKLWVQGDEAVAAYSNAETCWNKFDIQKMIEPTEIKPDGPSDIEGNAGDTFQLSVTLWPLNVTLNIIFWRSTNTDVATVDENGVVTLQVALGNNPQSKSTQSATKAHADLGGECKIIAESLYADAPLAEFTIRNNGTAAVDIIKNDISNSPNEGEIDYEAPYSVYNPAGQFLGNNVNTMSPGLYIVRQGGNVKKIAVK